MLNSICIYQLTNEQKKLINQRIICKKKLKSIDIINNIERKKLIIKGKETIKILNAKIKAIDILIMNNN